MASCNTVASPTCWSFLGLGEDSRIRNPSSRPILLRWKQRSTKAREARANRRPEDRERSADNTPWTSVSRKLSQPVLRAIQSVRHLELLHSLSDVELRRDGALASRTHPGRHASRPGGHPADIYASPPAHVTHVSRAPGPKLCPSRATVLTQPSRRGRPLQTSRFLALPQEIRDEIYAYVFCSTRLTVGRRVACVDAASSLPSCPGPASSSSPPPCHPPVHVVTHIKPALHALALFRVCRQITRELRSDDAWLGQVLFNFEDVATMLDVLGGVLATPARRSRVREVRVREGGLFVHQRLPPGPALPSVREGQQQHHASHQQQQFRQRFLLLGGLMRLLPGLRLDRLTVLPALPCRVHRSTRCHNVPSVDMYNLSVTSSPPPPAALAAPHEMLAELLQAGCGWRELCYVHHDTNMLTADRRRPSSVEAMMVNMGFWDADADTYDDVFAGPERAARLDTAAAPPPHTEPRPEGAGGPEVEAETEAEAEAEATVSEGPAEDAAAIVFRQHRRHRLGSLFASFSAKKEYRLPRWRRVLTERDGLVPPRAARLPATAAAGSATAAAGWNVSIDTVIDEGFCEGDTPRSTLAVYGVRAGRAMWSMETLEDVHDNRIRGADFMVVVRRGDGGGDGESNDGKGLWWQETAGNGYPFAEGDPRALGYGSRWETLRPVLFPWDHVAVTRCRHDRYRHRDEYVIRSPRRREAA